MRPARFALPSHRGSSVSARHSRSYRLPCCGPMNAEPAPRLRLRHGGGLQMMQAVWIATAVTLAFGLQEQGAKTSPDKPQASRPAPSSGPSTTTAPNTTPRDAEVLRELIREVERQPGTTAKGTRAPVPSSLPSDPRGGRSRDEAPVEEGGAVVDRTGRLTRVGQWIEFRFERDDGKGTASFQLQPNAALEQVERDVDAGATLAIISGEVQRYRGKSYLLVKTYRRAAQRGNLSP